MYNNCVGMRFYPSTTRACRKLHRMSDASDHTPHAPPTGQGHEGYEVQLRPVVLSGVVLVLSIVLVFVMMGWLFNTLMTRQAARDVAPSPLARTRPALPAEPRLQVAPAQELQQLHADEEAALQSYGWINQAAGIVRIPIERAMDLVYERGLPVRPGVVGPTSGPEGRQP
jgi:hypothetical protein